MATTCFYTDFYDGGSEWQMRARRLNLRLCVYVCVRGYDVYVTYLFAAAGCDFDGPT